MVSFAKGIGKGIGRVAFGEKTMKIEVEFTAISLDVASFPTTFLKFQVFRGDQKPVEMPVMKVDAGTQSQKLQFATNPTTNPSRFDCSIFTKDNIPLEKLTKLNMYITD